MDPLNCISHKIPMLRLSKHSRAASPQGDTARGPAGRANLIPWAPPETKGLRKDYLTCSPRAEIPSSTNIMCWGDREHSSKEVSMKNPKSPKSQPDILSSDLRDLSNMIKSSPSIKRHQTPVHALCWPHTVLPCAGPGQQAGKPTGGAEWHLGGRRALPPTQVISVPSPCPLPWAPGPRAVNERRHHP